MKRGPSMHVAQSSEPVGLEAMREALRKLGPTPWRLEPHRDNPYNCHVVDAEGQNVLTNVGRAFGEWVVTAAALQLPEAEIQSFPVANSRNGEPGANASKGVTAGETAPISLHPSEANSTAAPVGGGIVWRRVNDDPFEYAIQQGPHGDEFVELVDGSYLRRPLASQPVVRVDQTRIATR